MRHYQVTSFDAQKILRSKQPLPTIVAEKFEQLELLSQKQRKSIKSRRRYLLETGADLGHLKIISQRKTLRRTDTLASGPEY
jgi:restriction endonuclease S subunit